MSIIALFICALLSYAAAGVLPSKEKSEVHQEEINSTIKVIKISEKEEIQVSEKFITSKPRSLKIVDKLIIDEVDSLEKFAEKYPQFSKCRLALSTAKKIKRVIGPIHETALSCFYDSPDVAKEISDDKPSDFELEQLRKIWKKEISCFTSVDPLELNCSDKTHMETKLWQDSMDFPTEIHFVYDDRISIVYNRNKWNVCYDDAIANVANVDNEKYIINYDECINPIFPES